MRPPLLLPVLALLIACGTEPAAPADPTPPAADLAEIREANGVVIRDLGPLPGYLESSTVGQAVNSSGAVAGLGRFEATLALLLWRSAGPQTLPAPAGALEGTQRVAGITENGVVFGTAWKAIETPYAVRWRNGIPEFLDGIRVQGTYSVRAAGNAILVNGWSDAAPLTRRVVLWREREVIELPFNAVLANNEGTFVVEEEGGYSLWRNGRLFATLPPDFLPYAINGRRQVLGAINNVYPNLPMLWESGRLTDLPWHATDLTESGVVLSHVPFGRNALWCKGEVLYLPDLTENDRNTVAFDISPNGQFVTGQSLTADGQQLRAVRWTIPPNWR